LAWSASSSRASAFSPLTRYTSSDLLSARCSDWLANEGASPCGRPSRPGGVGRSSWPRIESRISVDSIDQGAYAHASLYDLPLADAQFLFDNRNHIGRRLGPERSFRFTVRH